jgi:hypothetical protein
VGVDLDAVEVLPAFGQRVVGVVVVHVDNHLLFQSVTKQTLFWYSAKTTPLGPSIIDTYYYFLSLN